MKFRNVLKWSEGVSVRPGDMVRMAGNGMHVCQVGAGVMWALLATHIS